MQKRLLISGILILLSANLFLIGCADDQARAQIAETNARVTQLQGNVGVIDNKISNQKMIDILNKLDDLQSQIDQLNGNVSTISANQKSYQATQEQLYQSIEQRLQALEQATNGGSSRSAAYTTSSAPLAGGRATPGNNELKSALRKVKSHNFPVAIKELKNIISTSADPEVISSATYYLTISYAANGQYKEAITQGRKFANDYPDNANAPDALRTVYISQNQLNMKQSAAKTANLIITKYPSSDAAQKIKAEMN
ncbi:MAG: hypothetical protein KBD37_00450 [Burkholderiales bacterium]|nr:hypothetical protein [Burkholderiales bacterium]